MFTRPAVKLKDKLPTSAYRISKLSTVRTTPSVHPTKTTTINNLNSLNRFNQTRKMSFFPRLAHPSGDFTPLFRLLDDYESHRSGTESASSSTLRSFAPRFDVRETKDAYHLDGELPGIAQKDIDIEFTDAQTLVVKGRSEREYSASSGGDEEPSDAGHGGKKTRQATVEDEDASSTTAVTKTGGKSQEVGSPLRGGMKYWVSERSVGEFSRSFNFPTRVDQDKVKASLKNGILSIAVPKAAAPTSKRINIE
ncbi:heat shock protein [Histoplasma capsulatum G186AR]|uniref:Heat shock protein n=2 Tax=Ajellomyces capsulatus TaxID=5037 RepID=C0P152_AJECG|nr:heat shock protein [Histoplasma capsulatum G186AR]EEH02688.1 heat shock protein [Histoplasma capsulatum G186AR]KAG5288423.1 heat shock protein [Histoplasma capsulatum]QSS70999.1 heat shock protein [Histoplasma capsulatum G186AR]